MGLIASSLAVAYLLGVPMALRSVFRVHRDTESCDTLRPALVDSHLWTYRQRRLEPILHVACRPNS